jgi:hypothetical protein
VVLSLKVNYTDWATTICQWNLLPTFVDSGVLRGQHGRSPTVVNLSFLDQSRYFSFKSRLIYPHKGRVDSVPHPLLLRKSGSSENRTRDLWVGSQELWPLDRRGGHDIPFSTTNLVSPKFTYYMSTKNCIPIEKQYKYQRSEGFWFSWQWRFILWSSTKCNQVGTTISEAECWHSHTWLHRTTNWEYQHLNTMTLLSLLFTTVS